MANILTYPDALSLASNLKKFVISSAEDIRFKLYCGATLIIDESYSPASDGKITIDVKEVVKNELSFIIPITDVFLQSGICKEFIAHVDFETKTFLAIRAGVENLAVSATEFLTQNFLTWQPQSKQVGYSQPEWLTYYAPVAGNLKVKFYLSDNTSVVQTLTALVAGYCISVNMMFSRIMALQAGSKQGYFDVWFENAAAERLTYIQRYIYKETETIDEHFLFENSLGGIDTAVMSGESVFAPELTHTEGVYEEESEQLDDAVSRLFQKSTGWKSKVEAAWLWDFFRAIRKYKVDSGVIRKITLKESEVTDSSAEDMKSFSFTYRIAADKGLLNIQRSTDPLPENLEITTPEGLFFLAPRLVDFPSAELLDELIIPAQSPYEESWKKFSLGGLKSWIMSFVSTSEIGTSSHNHTNKSILDKITSLLGSNDAGAVTEGSLFSGLRSRKEFLRKDVADTAAEKITFTKGIKSDAIESKDMKSNGFVPGFEGEGFSLRLDENGNALLDVDIITARKSANFKELIIQQQKYQGGIVFYTAAAMECSLVTEQADSYRCFFDTKDGQLPNDWILDDQARCQRFAGKYYWRKVIALGDDYIDISKSDTDGAGIPEKGDMIVQFGNRTDTTRQSAIVTTTIGVNTPRTEFYEGINSYSLIGKLITVLGMKDGKAGIYTNYGEFAGKVTVGAGSSGLTELSEWAAAAQDIQDAAAAAAEADRKAVESQEKLANDIDPKLAQMQAQIDGEISSYYQPYSPTLANYPANEWLTTAAKEAHLGDTFNNNLQFVSDSETPDAGKSWRWTKSGTEYFWNPISDSDSVLALKRAAEAKGVADGKSTHYLIQPTTYKFGDSWVCDIVGDAEKGSMLFATQDSNIFNRAHWVKKDKYTDDTTVNALQIGGRNLIRLSRGQIDFGSGYFVLFMDLAVQPILGQKYTISWEDMNIPNNEDGYGVSVYLWSGSWDSVKTFAYQFQGGKGVFSNTITSPLTGVYKLAFYRNSKVGGYVVNPKLETGDKATDHTLAIEDVEASIDSIGLAVSTLNTYVDGSFKDNVISKAEAQAIEKYTNSVNASKLQIQSAYSQLYTNAHLEGTAKTNLASAKTDLDTAITNLLASIATAIADGQTTPTEKTDVDAKFGLYNTALSTYQIRVEEANKAIQDKLKTYSDAASLTATEAKNYIDNVLPNDIASLQAQIDGVIDSWYFAYVPSLSNFPASDWTTDTIKARHVGDTFTNTQPFISDVETPDAGKSWRFAVNAGVYFWTPIADSDAVKALLAASKAQDTADNKRRNFLVQPFTPYEVGDMWSQGSAGDLMKCVTTRLTGNYNAADWEKAVKYTDDTAANAAQQTANTAVTNAAAANALLLDIASDSKLTASEKQLAKKEWDSIVSEKSKNDDQADVFSVSKAVYGVAYDDLNAYITPLLANLTTTSDIIGTTFRTTFKNYYDARTDLLNAIATAAKAQAISAASTDATNKVNAIQIGGKNLIKNSNIPVTNGNFPTASFYMTEDMIQDQVYTISFKANLGEGKVSWLIYLNGGSIYLTEANRVAGTHVYIVTFNGVANNNGGNNFINFYPHSVYTSVNSTIEWVQLEKGNKATDHRIAPQETAAAIAAAKATADEAAAVTSKFGVEINGGLIYAAMMKFRDPLSPNGAETAGMNGNKGTGKNPAIWAGGNYTQALQLLAAIVLNHDGSGKIGELLIDPNGVLKILDPATGQERLIFNASELPALATLLDSAQITGSQYNSGVSLTSTGSSIRPSTLSVTQANSKLSLVGGWSISALAPTTGTALVYAHIYILKDGAFYTSIKSVNLTLNTNNSSEDIDEAINFSLSSVPVGVYSVAVDLSISEDGSHDISVNLTLDESTISFVFEKDIKQVRFGTDGQMLFYAADKYLYLTSKPGGPFIKSRGEWDVPGLRGSGSVDSGGTFANGYGKASNSAKNSTGLYTITHSLGHINYGINLTIVSSNGQLNAVVTAKNTTSFDVRIVNTSNNTLTDSAFDFSIYGNN